MGKGTNLVFGTISFIAVLSIIIGFFSYFGLSFSFINEAYYGSYFVLFISIFLLGLFDGNLIGGLLWGSVISGVLFLVLVIIIPAII
ncbi:MAG: Putative uncharacterized membrane protein [Candidatus Parvarchaeum acidiphilum ARMAN-4_'5-way FS']|jgi:hypothetical protein|uniref:Uncharacterized membrane protein n=1 Tax=Candidatus Parvarchaeum acidiphilum ARMAN-4_'5-way FS' TaxID=994837 RepID=F2UTW9_PARA4|nr:MAG: Putative uncharacterized membrane protein [Candidatus Parvarchaeum acidiphilum ARMAN-4_'5-way FS']